MRILPVMLTVGLLVAAGCETDTGAAGSNPESNPEGIESESTDRSETMVGSTRQTLDRLKQKLQKLEDGQQAEEPVKTGGDIDVEPLEGLNRDEIRGALGVPNRCRDEIYEGSDGERRLTAPCRTERDWFYSFYRLPEGSNGGGPELLLQFDDNGACTEAVWQLTQ